MNFCSEQLHAEYVELLSDDVFYAHINLALQPEEGTRGGRSHSMLTGAGLGNDAFLAHSDGEEGLADGVVDLVRAGVVEVFALDGDVETGVFAEVSCLGKGRWSADVFGEEPGVFGSEGWVRPSGVELFFKLFEGWHQGFGDVPSTVAAKPSAGIRA